MTTTDDFHTLVSDLDYPMFVVTAAAPAGPRAGVGGVERAGCLVGFATQASIDPPRLLVLLSKANHTFGVAQRSDHLAVHYLSRDNRDLAVLFGTETGDRIDKFAACAWTDGPLGAPVLARARGWVEGRILARWDAGDHVAHLLDVASAHVAGPSGRPDNHQARPSMLGFQDVRTLTPGHPT
jgi:flavin reductase (DIM6/NTAB) family NADH-FMN oxidoreductase RutF